MKEPGHVSNGAPSLPPMTAEREAAVVRWLASKGAESIPHPGGHLLAHLRRTAARLSEWGAPAPLVAAGLCHAAYGTHGFAPSLLPLTERATLVEVAGVEAEAIVYAYAAVDRVHGLPGVDGAGVTVRDRFTGREAEPAAESLRQLVELSCANELDVLLHGPESARAAIAAWLARASRLASPRAAEAVEAALRDPSATPG